MSASAMLISFLFLTLVDLRWQPYGNDIF
jgi:hypothetical protein